MEFTLFKSNEENLNIDEYREYRELLYNSAKDSLERPRSMFAIRNM